MRKHALVFISGDNGQIDLTLKLRKELLELGFLLSDVEGSYNDVEKNTLMVNAYSNIEIDTLIMKMKDYDQKSMLIVDQANDAYLVYDYKRWDNIGRFGISISSEIPSSYIIINNVMYTIA